MVKRMRRYHTDGAAIPIPATLDKVKLNKRGMHDKSPTLVHIWPKRMGFRKLMHRKNVETIFHTIKGKTLVAGESVKVSDLETFSVKERKPQDRPETRSQGRS